jgi:hypothetical protein
MTQRPVRVQLHPKRAKRPDQTELLNTNLRQSSLGVKHFEELQIMKFAWRKKIVDNAEQNWTRVEEVQLKEYSEFLEVDETSVEWDKELLNADEFILDDLD